MTVTMDRAQTAADLPTGWSWTRVGELLNSIEAGKSFKCDERIPRKDEVGVVKVSAVTWGVFDENESKTCTRPDLVNPAYFIESGDFLFSRANTIDLVGACVLVGSLSRTLMLSDKILRLRFNESTDPRLILWFLRSIQGRREIESLATGNQESMRNIGQERIRRIRLPIAPQAEQTRIVEAIESYFTRLDNAVATLERVQANLKRYRASVLKAAVEGRLVPTEADLARQEGRDYEPASELLKRILVERRRRWEEAELATLKAKGRAPKDDRWKAKYKEPVAPDTSELPELPEGWCWASLEGLADVCDPNPSHRMPKYSGDGFPFISTENFVGENEIDFSIGKLVSGTTVTDQINRFTLRDGSFALSRIGTIGRTRRLPLERDYAMSHALCVITPHLDALNSAYLRYAVSSHVVLDQAREGIRSIGVPDLGMATIRRFNVPLPPTLEQERIVAEIDRLNTVCAESEKLVSNSRSRGIRLRQSILKWAFEGKLADQDPNDEPASVLLDRIKAERETKAVESTPRTRKTRNGRKRNAA